MFEPVDKPFNPVSHSIGFPVKWTASFIITFSWNSYMNAMLYQIVSNPLGTIAFVSNETLLGDFLAFRHGIVLSIHVP